MIFRFNKNEFKRFVESTGIQEPGCVGIIPALPGWH